MFVRNPHAIYVNCDGAMDYDSNNTGGVGFIITFPDHINLDEILVSKGTYIGGNIERIEYEALIQGMTYVLELFKREEEALKNISQIIFVSDRFALNDNERTNPYRIKSWRQNKWKNHEGKPIKNHDLLDELDKMRKKLSDQTSTRVNIIYRPRKYNKAADKLAKLGKTVGLTNDSLKKKGEKIGRRSFDGGEIKYSKLYVNQQIHIKVFRKDPVQELWEVWVELYKGDYMGEKMKIYVDNVEAAKLKRGNYYRVKVKEVFTHHITVFKSVNKLKGLKKS